MRRAAEERQVAQVPAEWAQEAAAWARATAEEALAGAGQEARARVTDPAWGPAQAAEGSARATAERVAAAWAEGSVAGEPAGSGSAERAVGLQGWTGLTG